jgi:hypothetical protein
VGRVVLAVAVSLALHGLFIYLLGQRVTPGQLSRTPERIEARLTVRPLLAGTPAISPSLLMNSREQMAPPPRSSPSGEVKGEAPLALKPSPPALIRSRETANANVPGTAPAVPPNSDPIATAAPDESASSFLRPKDVDQTPIALAPPSLDQLSGFPNAVQGIRFRTFVTASGHVDHVEILDAAKVDRPLAEKLAQLIGNLPYQPARKDGRDVDAYYDFEIQLVDRFAPSPRPEIPATIPHSQ